MSDENGNGEVWTKIDLHHDVVPDLDPVLLLAINEESLLAAEGTHEVQMLQQGRCLCGTKLGEETVLISNAGGNLAVMCSSQCLDDHMALGFLGNMLEAIGQGVQQRKVQSELELQDEGEYSD